MPSKKINCVHRTKISRSSASQGYSNFFNTTENNDSKNRYQSQASGYQQLINFVINGDVISAREFIEKAGFSGILADFLLDNAEIDAMLEIAANFAAVGGCDD